MKTYHIPPSRPAAGQPPRLLYVSSWEQTRSNLPRSLHSHPDFAEFTFILAGRGVCELDGTLYPVEKGDLIVCNSGVLHDEFVDTHPLSLISIAATGIARPGLPKNCVIESNIIPIFHLYAAMQEFHTLLSLLAGEVKSTDPHRDEICQALFLALFYKILGRVDAGRRQAAVAHDVGADLAHRIRAYVDLHMAEELTVKDVAALFSISSSYLARIFKSAIGCPMSQYIIRRRLGEAQTLLLNTALPISEVAALVGYPNQSYFTKLFTRAFRISPLQYRKLSSQQLVNLSYAQALPGAGEQST